MTDKQIVKALEHCVNERSCTGCIAYSPRGCQGIDEGTLNIITRQNKEIESLKTKVDICEVIIQTLRDENKGLKAELERIRDEESEEDYK